MDYLTVPFLSNDSFVIDINTVAASPVNTCPICLISEPEHVLDQCQHSFCNICLVSYLNIKISEAQVNDLSCPTCGLNISEELVQSIISETSFKRLKDFQKIKKLELDLYVKFCPVADCKGYDIANDTNTKLACSECGHKYCYYCSQEWHKGKCKDNTELSFKLWAFGNNIKICPRCKNHVEKNGGCPQMKCPRCHFNWCWKCGKSTSSSSHNEFTCLIGRNWYELYWGIIFLLLFSPVLIPFLLGIGYIYIYETGAIDGGEYFPLFRHFVVRLLLYIIFMGLCPFIEIIILIGCGLSLIGIITSFLSDKYSVFCLFGFIIGCLATSLCSIVLALVTILGPIGGLFFLVIKIICALKRGFTNNQVISYEVSLFKA